MSGSKHAMRGSSAPSISPDEIGWDPDDAPELGDSWFDGADHFVGDRLIRRGYRPGETERLVLPAELVERFKACGDDWPMRIEAALREWLDTNSDQGRPKA